jgi:hypothetical protein
MSTGDAEPETRTWIEAARTRGSDGAIHAFWTDSNNKQTVVWFYGLQFVPTPINQEDVVVWNGNL